MEAGWVDRILERRGSADLRIGIETVVVAGKRFLVVEDCQRAAPIVELPAKVLRLRK